MSQDERVGAILAALSDPLTKLRDAGNVACPSDELAREALTGCVKADGSWRKTKPADGPAELLWQLVKFHRGSGSLYGFPWFADAGLRDQLDTLAVLLLGGQSSAAAAWQRALS